ncbi:hypothetical protein PGTUg99_003776 [Puccinia graminis f. sp. tritici]|uniref:Uncharacterized protein n=1 Tax=Puccinia graminis f. sp. tritici TaxID=56615 RepID=A0A5B0N867_PUCGR|nr:hypothetical protein PGTUg99_003776 [Puccinia graminis f. sp. tritici]
MPHLVVGGWSAPATQPTGLFRTPSPGGRTPAPSANPKPAPTAYGQPENVLNATTNSTVAGPESP